MGKQARLKKERSRSRQAILDAYTQVATKYLPTHFSQDRCLNGSRIAIEVLSRWDLKPRPLVTYTIAMNAPFWEKCYANNGFPVDQEEALRWEQENGAWAVAVAGEVDGRPGYPGHLVVIADGFLVDSAAGQFCRPHRRILLPEVIVAPAPTSFLTGAHPLIFTGDEVVKGTVISYEAHPDDRSYENVAGFWRSAWNLEAADAIHERMKELLSK